jgi:hypothetical protein
LLYEWQKPKVTIAAFFLQKIPAFGREGIAFFLFGILLNRAQQVVAYRFPNHSISAGLVLILFFLCTGAFTGLLTGWFIGPGG